MEPSPNSSAKCSTIVRSTCYRTKRPLFNLPGDERDNVLFLGKHTLLPLLPLGPKVRQCQMGKGIHGSVPIPNPVPKPVSTLLVREETATGARNKNPWDPKDSRPRRHPCSSSHVPRGKTQPARQ